MTDIVKKLREFESFLKDPKPGEHVIKSDIFDDAADEIERLRGLLDLYREAVVAEINKNCFLMFKGCDKSALERAWREDLKTLGEKE